MSTGKLSGVLGWFWMGSGAAFYPPGIWARGLFGLACQWRRLCVRAQVPIMVEKIFALVVHCVLEPAW